MNEKINILDIYINDCTAKQAMKETVAYMKSELISVVEMVTVDMLMFAKEEPELKESLEQLDLVLPGEKEILEAADITDRRQLQEVEVQTYLKMFLRYLHKNHCRVFLLVESEEEVEEFYDFLEHSYGGIQIAGIARVSADDQADDMLINAVNGAEVDCVIAALSSPLQEKFIVKNRSLLNARVWLGAGKVMRPLYKARHKKNRITQFIIHRIFKREIEKQKRETEANRDGYSCQV